MKVLLKLADMSCGKLIKT